MCLLSADDNEIVLTISSKNKEQFDLGNLYTTMNNMFVWPCLSLFYINCSTIMFRV